MAARRALMRQVNQDELTWLLVFGLEQLPASVRAMMHDRRPDTARKGAHLAAQQLAARLGRLEILSSAPPPPPFRFADIEGGSGVPMIEG